MNRFQNGEGSAKAGRLADTHHGNRLHGFSMGYDAISCYPNEIQIGRRQARPELVQCELSKERFIAKTQQNTWAKKVREQEAKRKADEKRLKRQIKRDNLRGGNG